jgi:hypothetical protein
VPATLQFFDMAVSVTPPGGHLEPLPLTLGPNWQPNDIRLFFLSLSGADSKNTRMMRTNPSPPTGFTSAFSQNPTSETHAVFWRRLVAGDNSTGAAWAKPQNWRHFMFGSVTVRGATPTAAPTAGSLSDPGDVTYTVADSTTSASVASVTVPSAGTMVFFLGDVAAPMVTQWPAWAVSLGTPSGWTNLAATEKSGGDYYQYGTDPALMMFAKSYASAGSTGTVTVPAGQGSPAFSGLYCFLVPAPDVSVSIVAA